MIDLYLRLKFIEEKHNKMKLKFSLKLSLLVFFAVAHGFSAAYSSTAISPSGMDTEENTKVLAGMKYIAKQYKKRCDDFNAKPVETSAGSLQTERIIDLLSNPEKVSRQEASEEQKREIAQSVMATIFVHGGLKKLTPNNLKEGDTFYRHFRALELIEDLSFALNGSLKNHDGCTVLDDVFLSTNWENYRDLEAYSSITKDMFKLWFNAALKEHHGGFVKLAEIAEIEIRKTEGEKQRVQEEAGALEALRGLARSSTDATGGDNHLATPKRKLFEGSEFVPTPNMKSKAKAKTISNVVNNPLNAVDNGKEFQFNHIKSVDEIAVYEVLGMTKCAFDVTLKNVALKSEDRSLVELAEICKRDLFGSLDGSALTSDQLIDIIDEIGKYYISSGHILFLSKIFSDLPICIWEHKDDSCILTNIYFNGANISHDSAILNDTNLFDSIRKRIGQSNERHVHLHRTADDSYYLLELVQKEKSATKIGTSRSRLFSPFTFVKGHFMGTAIFFGTATFFATLFPKTAIDLIKGVFNFSTNLIPRLKDK